MKTLRDPKRRPTHPGAILREVVLPTLEMTQTEFAQRLGVSRLTVSDLLHEKRVMTPEMAARIAKLLKGISKNPNFVAILRCSINFNAYISNICGALKFLSRLVSLRILNF